jgi:hypothetical protein
MSGFLFAFLAVLIAGLGARDQQVVAVLAAKRGQRPASLIIAMLSAIVATAIAAAGARLVIPMLAGEARAVLAALALALAGAEMLLARRWRRPQEPTDSLGAFAIVLFAQQLTDAARFLVFAIAVATAALVPAALGGALGSIGVVAAGWIGADELVRRNLAPLRRGLGGVLLAIGLYLGLATLG